MWLARGDRLKLRHARADDRVVTTTDRLTALKQHRPNALEDLQKWGAAPAASPDHEEQSSLREISDPAAVFATDVVCEQVERHFARFPEASSAVLRHPAGTLSILTRRRVTLELSGRLGYGRVLYARRPVSQLPGSDETLILDDSVLLSEAGSRVLARPQGHRYDDIVVTSADGTVSTVTVARLFGELARLHAHRAVHDRLTGLPNREFFVEGLRALTGPIAVLFIDLDDFKSVNDSLGHSVGDELLIVVAERLRSVAAEGEMVARLSGDEFGVLQPGGNEDSARLTALRIQEVFSESVTLLGWSVAVSASIGIAVSTGDDVALLRNADLAMYESKRSGKRRHTVYRAEMFSRASRRLELKTDIDNALANGELRLVYQPILRFHDAATVAVEALLRWRHPRLGEIAPLDFVPLAEESGAILPIGRWVMEEACRQVRQWEQELGIALNANVNISSRQLEQREFPDYVRAALAAAGLDAARLALEVTETAVAADDGIAFHVLGELADVGVTLAIDDFGTGFSSLERLGRLPVDVLKVDKGFVARLDGERNTTLLHGLRSFCDSMGIDAIVEGIETPEQLQALTGLGYSLGQGYHMSGPVEAEDMAGWLR